MIDRLRALWTRPIRDEERMPIFLGAAVVLVLAAVLLALTRGGEEAVTAARPAAAEPEPAAPAPDEPLPRREAEGEADRERPATVSGRDVRAAKRTARRFLTGYLPYSYGRGPASAVGTAATPELRAELAATPPRASARVRRLEPRVGSVQVEAMTSRSVAVAAFVEDGERSYSIALGLERGASGWQVSGLGT